MSESPPSRSVHGGSLGVDDRVLRAAVADRLFGKKTLATIGRFKVRRMLGAGGMGQVFEAEDPELDRLVAVKVLRRVASDDHERGHSRMQREAKAQAQLKDPHVVTVHEVGPFEDGLYIAMELVEGPTLRAWIKQGHPWREVLDKFLQAGRGLAAAHKRGLVHRDFKPDNVLIDGEDGRARVADFGLVQVGEVGVHEPATPGASPTTIGAGTPQYMSPEQRIGDVVDARSDQYSFCIALDEALGPEVSPRLRKVIERGRSASPDDRYADMEHLLTALRKAAAPRRAIPIALGIVGVGALTVALWPRTRDCAAEADLVGVWDETVQTEAAAQAEAAEVSYVAGAWPATVAVLDDFATSWKEQRVRACELADVRDEAFDARSLDCLQASRDDLAFVTAGLVAGDPDVLATALHLGTGLSSPRACNDEARLESWNVPADEATAARREETRTALRTAALQLATARTGASGEGFEDRLKAATEAAQSARDGAQSLDDAALESRALYLLGQLAEHRGDTAAAEEFLKQSAARAEVARDNRARVRALSFQVYVIGSDPDRLGEVLQVAAQAESVLAAVGDPPLLRAQLVGNLGTVKARARRPDKEGAIADLREALELLTQTVGEDHPDVLSARVNLGNTLGRIGETAASRAELEAAATAAPRVWGPSHPLTGRVVGMFGMALLRAGDVAGARAQLEAALATSDAALGPDHHQVADAHYNLAIVLQRQKEFGAAAEHLRKGLASRRRVLGEKNGGLIAWHFELGKAELGRGHKEAAEETLTRALELCESDGAPARDFARVRFALAQAVVDRDPASAKFLAERAAQAYRKLGRDTKLREVEAFLAGL